MSVVDGSVNSQSVSVGTESFDRNRIAAAVRLKQLPAKLIGTASRQGDDITGFVVAARQRVFQKLPQHSVEHQNRISRCERVPA